METEACPRPNLFEMPLWTKCGSGKLLLNLGLFALTLGQFTVILILSTLILNLSTLMLFLYFCVILMCDCSLDLSLAFDDHPI